MEQVILIYNRVFIYYKKGKSWRGYFAYNHAVEYEAKTKRALLTDAASDVKKDE